MTTLILEREFQPLLDARALREMLAGTAERMSQDGITWRESFVSQDGGSLLCNFQAPNVESIRRLSREDDCIGKSVWAGTVHDTGRAGLANVVVARRFEVPTTVESLQVIEDAAAWCLQLHKVTFLRTFFSTDQRRMICLYQAPDAESVRLAQHQAGMPVERIWACQVFTAATISGDA